MSNRLVYCTNELPIRQAYRDVNHIMRNRMIQSTILKGRMADLRYPGYDYTLYMSTIDSIKYRMFKTWYKTWYKSEPLWTFQNNSPCLTCSLGGYMSVATTVCKSLGLKYALFYRQKLPEPMRDAVLKSWPESLEKSKTFWVCVRIDCKIGSGVFMLVGVECHAPSNDPSLASA